MKKKNIFSRIAIWSFLLSPMFVSCTQDEFFDESCMYSTNASRFGGAGMEMMHTVSKEGTSFSEHLQVGNLPINEIYGTITLSWPGGEPFSSIDSQIKAVGGVGIVAEDKYRCLSTTKSLPSSHNWVASATFYARIERINKNGKKDTVSVSFSHSATIETTEVPIP